MYTLYCFLLIWPEGTCRCLLHVVHVFEIGCFDQSIRPPVWDDSMIIPDSGEWSQKSSLNDNHQNLIQIFMPEDLLNIFKVT